MEYGCFVGSRIAAMANTTNKRESAWWFLRLSKDLEQINEQVDDGR
jgi:hypothetical protein